MTSLQQNDESSRQAVQKTWLPALESELKSRVGWVDEAVSPFATAMRAATKIQNAFQPGKAA
jgi:hypothetical protein